jgi:cytochrome c biogenesis protein CcdA/thiol-disulfide isomerase/thioredoxin
MQTEFINIGLGFIEGFALIISPCILPILPIILSGSLTGSKKRPIGIVIGFASMFAIFTLFSRKLTQNLGIDSNMIRHISYGILFLLGVIMLSTYLTEKFGLITQRLTATGSKISVINNPQGGMWSGILFGTLVAIIWTPCAGPILAAIIVQTVIQKTNLLSFLTLIAFGLGAIVPMAMIAIAGRSMMVKFTFFKKHTIFFRELLGVIIILSVAYMIIIEKGISVANAQEITNKQNLSLQNGISNPYPAPAIDGIDAWINSSPQNLNTLKGKVVLIDFWTYSCINCIRTLPYLKDWYNRYHNKGLVIIGVHTPEFDFEKDLNNVKNAVIQNKIEYPVALDNHFVTWQNFNNKYWPAHYLIDKNGNVVYTHFGEGDYDITEKNILYLLGMNNLTTSTLPEQEQESEQTPETYLGYARAENFSSNESVKQDKEAQYSFPSQLTMNNWALKGNWNIMSDRIISHQKNAEIEIHFHARKLFIVMGNATDKPIHVKLLLNGKNITSQKGKDVENSSITVNKHSIYEIVSLDTSSNAILHVIAMEPGLEVYTFTFGA